MQVLYDLEGQDVEKMEPSESDGFKRVEVTEVVTEQLQLVLMLLVGERVRRWKEERKR